MFFWLWIIVLVGAVFLEIGTASSLISIWFAVGSLFGLIANQLGFDFGIQVSVFVISSILSIVLVRPFVTKYIKQNTIATNADRIIGVQTRLLKPIDLDVMGEVKINGITWNAVSVDHHPIRENSIIEVRAIDGSKLVVIKID